MATKNPKVNTLDAVAVAILAFRANEDKINRLEGGNKDLIRAHFDNTARLEGALNPVLKEEALELINALNQRVMMNTLTGTRISEFLVSVNKLLQEDTVHASQFGLLAWAPKLYSDIQRTEDARETILGLAVNSNYVGQEGRKVELDFNVIACNYIQSYNSFAHTGHDGQGNLITMWTKERIPTGSRIAGRVKAHQRDKRNANALVTVLNYVKVL